MTVYEGTQLQRKIETRIREEKDLQILARSGGDKEQALFCQTNITDLRRTYLQLCKISGLPNRLNERTTVVGYKRIKK